MAIRGFSIRTRLIALVLAALLPALWADLWVVNLTHRLEREASERLLEKTTLALSMLLDRELTQRSVAVKALSDSRLLDTAPDMSADTLRDFDEQARRTLTGLGGWLELRSAQQVLLNTRWPSGGAPRPGSAMPLLDSPTVQPLQQDAPKGSPYAAVVQPVMRNGEPVLNLVLTVLPSEFQRIIDEQRLAPDWLAAIIDSDGRVVARHPYNAAHTGRLATPALQGHIAAERQGLVDTVSFDGQPVTVYYHTSPQGWTYVTGMSRERFEGLVPPAVVHVGIGLLVLLVISLVGAVWVARTIVRPIQTIKHMALEMCEGRHLAVPRTGLLECDQVAQAMDQASRSIRHSRADLERQVAAAVDRTRHLEQHVSHNQRVEALGRLTGGLAHEFNNLLGIIGNCAHLMRRQSTAPELTPAIDATLRAVDTGGRLTQHLLRFAGRQAVHPRTLPLQTFLPEVAELLRALLGRRIELSISIDAATPPVFADPNELELSLINLALNARDAIQGPGHLALHAAPATGPDCEGLADTHCVCITVRDDGPGMEDAIAQRAFEPFFSTKPAHAGTGLGLSQVYGFCQQAQGRVRLDSAPGQGTTVTLVLPAHGDAPDPEHVALPSPPSVATARVLLIEDNAALREATSALLGSYGCEVVAGADAQDALRLLEESPGFDVVLSDIVMPGEMDGVALANHLRQKLPQLPVVLISGNPGDTPLPPGVPLLHKPCSPETLVAVLEQAMAQARAR